VKIDIKQVFCLITLSVVWFLLIYIKESRVAGWYIYTQATMVLPIGRDQADEIKL